MRLPLGNLDWGDWVYGLVSAFISGGATAIADGLESRVEGGLVRHA